MSVFERKSRGRNFTFGRQPVPNQTGIEGTILNLSEPMQEKDFVTKEPAFWDKEKTRPKNMVAITLQTQMNEGPDDNGEPDDGARNIYVTVDYKPGGQLAAIQDAMDAVGARDLEVGGRLAVWFTGYDPESKNPDNPRRLFQARYALPPSGGGVFQQQPPAQAQQPVQATQPAPPAQFQQQPPAQQFAPQQAAQPPAQPAFQQQPPAQQFQTPPQQFQAPAQPQFQQPMQQTEAGPVNPGTGELPPQGQVYQPPQAAMPQQVQIDVTDIQRRLAQGQTDAQIMQETGASQEAVSAVRNLQPQQTQAPY